jgi:hypothetical protein
MGRACTYADDSLPPHTQGLYKYSNSAACQAGMQVGSSRHTKNIMTTLRPLELLHMDLFDPVAYLSIVRSKYGLVIVDEYTCFNWIFLL